MAEAARRPDGGGAAGAHDRRRFERFVLVYTPVWIAVVAAAQRWHFFAGWGDVAYLLFGVGLSAPLWAGWFFAGAHALRFNVSLVLLSFLQCYFGSWLFFEAFGMEYRFPVRLVLHGTPVFLYFLTIVYFATYFVVMSIAYRFLRARLPRVPAVVWRAVLAYAIAFAETATMATDAMREWFVYRGGRAVLWWGSIGYGLVFFITLPYFARLDEEGEPRLPLRRLLWDLLALNMLILIAYEIYAAVWARLVHNV